MPRMGGYVPSDHKARHEDGGRDEISIASLSGNPANRGAASGLASLNASSKVVEQPASISDFLEATPTDGLATKAADSNWAYDHAASMTLHHKVVRKTADETIQSNTSLNNDSALLFAVGANEVWFFMLFLLCNSHADADIKFTFAGPTGSSGYWNMTRETFISLLLLGTTTAQATTGGTTIDGCLSTGIIINGSTAGNLVFQWAQYVSQAQNTTVKANSCLIGIRLA